jgi:hypothetical protein
MLILSALALLSAPQAGPDPAARTPAEAFVAGVERVCPIYIKTDGMTAEDEAVLASEMAERVGSLGVLRQADPSRTVRVQGAPGACVVMIAPPAGEAFDPAAGAAVMDGLGARLSEPGSGWRRTSSETSEEGHRGQAWTREDGTGDLTVAAVSEGVVGTLLSRSLPFDTDSRIAARRAAAARPTDQAMLEALDSLCAVASTPAWAGVERGEVLIRHAGDSRLTVDYVLNGDCTVSAQGADAVAVGAALMAGLGAPGSSWTLSHHAWMAPNPYASAASASDVRGIEANYRHADGREAVVIVGDGQVQLQLWRPTR